MMASATDKKTGDRNSRGESEVFDKACLLVDAALQLFPHADPEDLKRTCEAAIEVAIDEIHKK